MKKNLAFIILLVSVLFSACEDNRMEGMMDDQFYLLKNGDYILKAYRQKSLVDFEVSIYKSGMGTASGEVTFVADESVLSNYNTANGVSYKQLPADCYTIDNSTVQFDPETVSKKVKITLDVKKVESLQGIGNKQYAIPLKISTTSGISVVADKSELILIPEISGGIRPNSEKLLWSKSLTEMGISGTDHFTASFAVTSSYLFVNSRNADLKYFNKLTGEYVGTIALPFKGSLANFTIANDDKDNLLITNLRNKNDGNPYQQLIYRITGTGDPVEYINSSHIYPNGRKLSIKGDLDGDALIVSTIENSSKFLYWTVRNGQLVSQDPQVFETQPGSIAWNLFGDAMPRGTDISNGFFIAGYGTLPGLGYFDNQGNMVSKYDLKNGELDPAAGFSTQALDLTTFNAATYLAVGTVEGTLYMNGRLLDVTSPQNISLNPLDSYLLAFRLNKFGCNNNANMTGDIHVKTSGDGQTMEMYVLGTNGSIVATQFDCKSED